MTVTPNEGDPVPADVRGRFFVARNVPLEDGDNTLVASTTATTLAGNEPTSDTVEDVELDTSLDQEYTYNANGDLIQKTEDVNGTTIQWDYTYSVDGWLTKVEKEVGGQTVLVEEYWYDPIGRKYKVVATAGGATTTRYFVYDGGSIVLELEKDGDNYLLEKEHVRGLSLGGGIGGLLYTRDADGTTGYFHYDGQGNVVSVTNEAQEEIAYYEYDAWGNILTACGSLANEFAFSTKQASLGTGLIDFGYRWYDPQTARWTQRDPIGYGDSTNLYGYVLASPTNAIDLDGLGLKKLIFAGNWNAPDDVYRAAWKGFSNSLADQWNSMSEAVFGDLASALYGVAPVNTADLYEDSAWGQSEGTWAEIPTKTCIIVAVIADTVALGKIFYDVCTGDTPWSNSKGSPGLGDAATPGSGNPCDRQPPRRPEYPGDDPTKPPESGTEWRGGEGSEPGDDRGNWHNPDTGESWHPDLDHGEPIGPHWDWKDEDGDWWRVFPDGTITPK